MSVQGDIKECKGMLSTIADKVLAIQEENRRLKNIPCPFRPTNNPWRRSLIDTAANGIFHPDGAKECPYYADGSCGNIDVNTGNSDAWCSFMIETALTGGTK